MSHTQNRRARRALLAVAIATVAIPAAAQASTATLEGTTLNISAAAGERNAVAVTDSGSAYSIRDAAGIRARTGCTQLSTVEVRCGGVGVNVQLGDLSDSFVAGTNRAIVVDAGTGDDSYVQNAIDGFTRVDFRGGAGFDTASYVNADRGVIVTKDGVANDGRIASGITSLDRDSIRADVEKLTGSRFNDSLNGNDATFDRFDGNLGDDVLSGHGLHDVFLMGSTDDGGDRIFGGAGSDTVDYSGRSANLTITLSANGADDGQAGEGDEIRQVENVAGGRGNDNIENIVDAPTSVGFNGGPGNDRLVGGAGNDFVQTGTGVDLVFGQAGSDQLLFDDADDGDVAQCGAGTDSVIRGPSDMRLVDCERAAAIGRLSLSPKVVTGAKPVRLSWTHPEAWRKLRRLDLRLTLDGAPVGEVTIRPRSGEVKGSGGVRVARRKLVRDGRTVTAELALKLDPSLDGARLRAEVAATDVRGRTQIG
jgi:Ca2+-binding RTX toxin-like protein